MERGSLLTLFAGIFLQNRRNELGDTVADTRSLIIVVLQRCVAEERTHERRGWESSIT